MNSYILKITGGSELSDKIDSTKSFSVKADLDCYAIEKRDNNDGTFDFVYKSKIVSSIELTQGETKITGKDKKRKSQKLRGSIYALGLEESADDNELFYDIVMDKLIYYLPEIWQSIKNR
jgi:hypothetical protein